MSATGNITGGNLSATGNVYDSHGQLFNVPASYAKYTRTTQQTGSLVANTVIVCNVSENTFGSDISVNTGTGQVTLQAGRTYRLRVSVPGWTTSGSNGTLQWCWYNETTPGWLGESGENYPGSTGASYGAAGGSAEAVFTPGVTTVVSFRILSSNNISALGGNNDFSTTGSYPWIDVQVIGGQAALTGFSTTGNITGGNVLTTGVISSAGNVTVSGTGGISIPNLPAFRVYGNGVTTGLNTTTNGTGVLNGNNWAVDYNQGSYLNSTTGTFTAPVAGVYQVNLVARCANNSAPSSQAIVYKNYGSANAVQVMWEVAANTTVNHFGVSTVSKLAVNDTLTLKVTVGNVTFDVNDTYSVAFLG